MLGGCIFGCVRRWMKQRHIHLQRRIAYEAQQLRLGRLFRRHQVEDHNSQGTNILVIRAGFVHDEYILLRQYFFGRQMIGNLDRHDALLLHKSIIMWLSLAG